MLPRLSLPPRPYRRASRWPRTAAAAALGAAATGWEPCRRAGAVLTLAGATGWLLSLSRQNAALAFAGCVLAFAGVVPCRCLPPSRRTAVAAGYGRSAAGGCGPARRTVAARVARHVARLALLRCHARRLRSPSLLHTMPGASRRQVFALGWRSCAPFEPVHRTRPPPFSWR